jgi:hypothetical protein
MVELVLRPLSLYIVVVVVYFVVDVVVVECEQLEVAVVVVKHEQFVVVEANSVVVDRFAVAFVFVLAFGAFDYCFVMVVETTIEDVVVEVVVSAVVVVVIAAAGVVADVVVALLLVAVDLQVEIFYVTFDIAVADVLDIFAAVVACISAVVVYNLNSQILFVVELMLL